ncbi:hypothetical protein CCP3SC15_380017 [Gammaproteobacteria bacterium]
MSDFVDFWERVLKRPGGGENKTATECAREYFNAMDTLAIAKAARQHREALDLWYNKFFDYIINKKEASMCEDCKGCDKGAFCGWNSKDIERCPVPSKRIERVVLAPCPFCGAVPVFDKVFVILHEPGCYFLRNCKGHLLVPRMAIDGGYSEWNRRAK